MLWVLFQKSGGRITLIGLEEITHIVEVVLYKSMKKTTIIEDHPALNYVSLSVSPETKNPGISASRQWCHLVKERFHVGSSYYCKLASFRSSKDTNLLLHDTQKY